MPIKLKKPILVSDTPVEAHQALRVSPDNASGKPEAKPKIRVAHRRDFVLLVGTFDAGMVIFKNSAKRVACFFRILT